MLKKKIFFSLLALIVLSTAAPFDGTSVSASSSESWIQTYELGNQDYVESFIHCSDSGYVIAGRTNMRSDRSQIWFLKIDSLGNMEWNQTYGTSGSRYFVIPSECCVIQTSDDGYAIANTVNNRVEMIKIDSAGNVEWTKTYEDGTFVRRLIETSDGGYVLLGSAGSFYVHTPWLAGLSPLGDIVWNKTYPNLGGSFSL
jgi:hypothetical protein